MQGFNFQSKPTHILILMIIVLRNTRINLNQHNMIRSLTKMFEFSFVKTSTLIFFLQYQAELFFTDQHNKKQVFGYKNSLQINKPYTLPLQSN